MNECISEFSVARVNSIVIQEACTWNVNSLGELAIYLVFGVSGVATTAMTLRPPELDY